jgi:hypothetical protein
MSVDWVCISHAETTIPSRPDRCKCTRSGEPGFTLIIKHDNSSPSRRFESDIDCVHRTAISRGRSRWIPQHGPDLKQSYTGNQIEGY